MQKEGYLLRIYNTPKYDDEIYRNFENKPSEEVGYPSLDSIISNWDSIVDKYEGWTYGLWELVPIYKDGPHPELPSHLLVGGVLDPDDIDFLEGMSD